MADKFVYGNGWGLKDKNFHNGWGDSLIFKFTQAKSKPKILPNGDLNGSTRKSNSISYHDNVVRFLTQEDANNYIATHPNFKNYIPFKARSQRVMRLVDPKLKVYETVPEGTVTDFDLFDSEGKILSSEKELTNPADVVKYLKTKHIPRIELPENIDVLNEVPRYVKTVVDTEVLFSIDKRNNTINFSIKPHLYSSISYKQANLTKEEIWKINDEIMSNYKLIYPWFYTYDDYYYILLRSINMIISVEELMSQEDSLVDYIAKKALAAVEEFYVEHKNELIRQVSECFEAIANEDQIIEQFSNKLVEENEIDNFKDKLLDIYDINGLILKLTKDKYQSFIWTDMALIQYGNGKGCIVDYEAVGKSFNSLDEKLEFDVAEKEEEVEQEDGSVVKSMAMFPYGKIKLSARDIMQNAESHQEEAGDFFSKCYGANWRCRENLEDVIDGLKSAGYFEGEAIIESLDDKENIIMELAKALNKSDPSWDVEQYFEEISHDVNNLRGDEWISTLDDRYVAPDLARAFMDMIGHYNDLAGMILENPQEYLYEQDSERLFDLMDYLRDDTIIQDMLASQLKEKITDGYPDPQIYTDELLRLIKTLEATYKEAGDKYIESLDDEKEKEDSEGIKIAKIIQDAMKDECGPFGGQAPRRNGRVIEMHSQSPSTFYTFHDDGSVDVVGQDYDSQGDKLVEFTFHYNNINEFLNSGDDGWFINFSQEHTNAVSKIHDVLDPETILENVNDNKASVIVYKGTKELANTEFDQEDDIGAVASRVISDIKDHPEADDVVLVYVDNLTDARRTVDIDDFKNIDINTLEQTLYDSLADEWYEGWYDTTDYADLEDYIKKLCEVGSIEDADVDDLEEEAACIVLVVCQFLDKPVDSVKSISFNEDGDYLRILFSDNSSHYFYNRGLFNEGIKDKESGKLLFANDFDPDNVKFNGDYESETFLEEYERITKKDEEWLDSKIKEHNFKVVSKTDYGSFMNDKIKNNVHYQIISNEGNKTKEDLEKEVNWIDELLDEFEGITGSPCTYNMGLQVDGYISCGFDCRATSEHYKDKVIEGWQVKFYPEAGDKVKLVKAPHVDDFTPVFERENKEKAKQYVGQIGVIDYCGWNDVDIKFKDGFIFRHATGWEPVEQKPEVYNIIESADFDINDLVSEPDDRFILCICDGRGAASRGLERDHFYVFETKASDLRQAVNNCEDQIRDMDPFDAYDEIKDQYNDYYDYITSLDPTGGDIFIAGYIQNGKRTLDVYMDDVDKEDFADPNKAELFIGNLSDAEKDPSFDIKDELIKALEDGDNDKIAEIEKKLAKKLETEGK